MTTPQAHDLAGNGDPIHSALSGPFQAAMLSTEATWSRKATENDRAGRVTEARCYEGILKKLKLFIHRVNSGGVLNPDIAARCAMALLSAELELMREYARASAIPLDHWELRHMIDVQIVIFTACLYDLARARLAPATLATDPAITEPQS